MKSNRLHYPNFGFPSGFGRLIRDAFEGFEDVGDFFSKPPSFQQRPNADLFEDDQSYVAVVELPGVARDDLKVEFLDGSLEVGATISRETKDGRKNTPIKRRIAIPDAVASDGLTAKLLDGVLTVVLPKAEAAKPRVIEVE